MSRRRARSFPAKNLSIPEGTTSGCNGARGGRRPYMDGCSKMHGIAWHGLRGERSRRTAYNRRQETNRHWDSNHPDSTLLSHLFCSCRLDGVFADREVDVLLVLLRRLQGRFVLCGNGGEKSSKWSYIDNIPWSNVSGWHESSWRGGRGEGTSSSCRIRGGSASAFGS